MKLSVWIEGGCFTSTDNAGDPICGGCGKSCYGDVGHRKDCFWVDLVRQGRAFAAQAAKWRSYAKPGRDPWMAKDLRILLHNGEPEGVLLNVIPR